MSMLVGNSILKTLIVRSSYPIMMDVKIGNTQNAAYENRC